jgi:hypothetical protein
LVWDDSPVAILGASRALLGLSSAVIEEETGRRVRHLGINGRCPLAAVGNIASDRRLPQGTLVVVALTSGCLTAGHINDQGKAIAHFSNVSFEALLNEWVASRVDSMLTSRHNQLGLRRIAYAVMNPPLRTRATPVTTLLSREVVSDYGRLGSELPAYREKRLARERNAPLEELDITPGLRVIAEAAEQLRAQGGKLVLVRMPVDEEHWAEVEHKYPRKRWWDRIGPEAGVDTVHFMDHPELQGFRLPDSSHLDASERDEFTRRLLGVLERAGIVERAR